MTDSDKDQAQSFPANGIRPAGEKLPYLVELWDLRRAGIEKVLARASSAQMARAIFVAAQSEHLGRRIVLKRGKEIIAESG